MIPEVVGDWLAELHLELDAIVETDQIVSFIDDLRPDAHQRQYLVETKLFQAPPQMNLLVFTLLVVKALLRMNLELKRNLLCCIGFTVL